MACSTARHCGRLVFRDRNGPVIKMTVKHHWGRVSGHGAQHNECWVNHVISVTDRRSEFHHPACVASITNTYRGRMRRCIRLPRDGLLKILGVNPALASLFLTILIMILYRATCSGLLQWSPDRIVNVVWGLRRHVQRGFMGIAHGLSAVPLGASGGCVHAPLVGQTSCGGQSPSWISSTYPADLIPYGVVCSRPGMAAGRPGRASCWESCCLQRP